jgi:hypothetical protein
MPWFYTSVTWKEAYSNPFHVPHKLKLKYLPFQTLSRFRQLDAAIGQIQLDSGFSFLRSFVLRHNKSRNDIPDTP